MYQFFTRYRSYRRVRVQMTQFPRGCCTAYAGRDTQCVYEHIVASAILLEWPHLLAVTPTRLTNPVLLFEWLRTILVNCCMISWLKLRYELNSGKKGKNLYHYIPHILRGGGLEPWYCIIWNSIRALSEKLTIELMFFLVFYNVIKWGRVVVKRSCI